MADTPKSRLRSIAAGMLILGLLVLAGIIAVPLIRGQGFAMDLLAYLALAVAGTGMVLMIVSGPMVTAPDDRIVNLISPPISHLLAPRSSTGGQLPLGLI